jgi:hypothetical protein
MCGRTGVTLNGTSVLTGECSEGAGSWEARDTGENYVQHGAFVLEDGRVKEIHSIYLPIRSPSLYFFFVTCVSCVFRL